LKEFDRFICGDALAELKKLPAESIDMCMTSPPYFGLRDYGNEQIFGGDRDCEHTWGINPVEHDAVRYRGHNANVGSNKNPEIHQGKEKSGGQDCIYCGAWKGQLGLEPTPELYIEHLNEIFNEVKRVLKKEGTLWIVIGDTYAGSGGAGGDYNKGGLREGQPKFKQGETKLPAKCLCMIPERLAGALIQDGWILRNKIIWSKPNAMPSSVKDRFSNRWEYIFLFSKNQRYYFDLDAVREPHSTKENRPFGIVRNREWGYDSKENYLRDTKIPKESSESYGAPRARYHRKETKSEIMHKYNPTYPTDRSCGEHDIGKNPGDVFEINTQPFPEAHFAVFPEKLCEKPIRAGCPEEICKKCGKARERIVSQERMNTRPGLNTGKRKSGTIQDPNKELHKSDLSKYRQKIIYKTDGWTSCNCNAGFEGGIILDPFAGAGTVGVVAKALGRRFILIDIKKEYINMAKKRVAKVAHQKELFEK